MLINGMEKMLEGNLFRLNFIKFLPKFNHSSLFIEDGTCSSTPLYT